MWTGWWCLIFSTSFSFYPVQYILATPCQFDFFVCCHVCYSHGYCPHHLLPIMSSCLIFSPPNCTSFSFLCLLFLVLFLVFLLVCDVWVRFVVLLLVVNMYVLIGPFLASYAFFLLFFFCLQGLQRLGSYTFISNFVWVICYCFVLLVQKSYLLK